jgi:hypothetical protein
MRTVEPLVPNPNPIEEEVAISKVRRYKLPGSEEMPPELFQARCETLSSKIHELINSLWTKE